MTRLEHSATCGCDPGRSSGKASNTSTCSFAKPHRIKRGSPGLMAVASAMTSEPVGLQGNVTRNFRLAWTGKWLVWRTRIQPALRQLCSTA